MKIAVVAVKKRITELVMKFKVNFTRVVARSYLIYFTIFTCKLIWENYRVFFKENQFTMPIWMEIASVAALTLKSIHFLPQQFHACIQ